VYVENQRTWYEVLLVCQWESYLTLLWAALLFRIRFDRDLYIFPRKLYASAVSYTTAVTRKFQASHLPWSSSHSPSCCMMFSRYRSLTSTPVMGKNEDSSLYREYESRFTAGWTQFECWSEHPPNYMRVLVILLKLLKLFVKWATAGFSQQYRNRFTVS
jgi:hypothetical protein